MPTNELAKLARDGNLEGFETKCLEVLSNDEIGLSELVRPFEQLNKDAGAARIATLGQMVLDNSDLGSDPASALRIARVAALADAKNAAVRQHLVELVRKTHAERPGFAAFFEASGLATGRPLRAALKILDLMSVGVGAMLMSSADDQVVEVTDVDLDRALFSVRQRGRTTTLTAVELGREYDRVDPNDIRVLKRISPDKLAALLSDDPVSIVLGILRAHGGTISQETLKNELSPDFLSEGEWAKWWTKTKALLKRDPHVTLEGRSPVFLKYTADARTLEDDTWDQFLSQNEPEKWLAVIEGYLREKQKDKQAPDAGLLKRAHEHLIKYIRAIEKKRPAEALACAIVTERLDEECGISGVEAKKLAVGMLRESPEPAALIAGISDANLWDLALAALEEARPDDAAAHATRLLRLAPSANVDTLLALARKGGQVAAAQAEIDIALAEAHRHPEIVFWLWKMTRVPTDLTLPSMTELFLKIIDVLSSLGRTLTPGEDVTKRFRHRMRTAFGLADFSKAKACFEQMAEDRAITVRSQLIRLDGLGDTSKGRLIELLRDVHPSLWKVRQQRFEPWNDPNIIWTTRAGLQRKIDEREHLVNVTMKDNARRIGEAAALGDLSENSEYKFALEERDLLRARLAKINADISLATPIDPKDIPTAHAGVGSKVTLRDISSGAERCMTFLGPFDSDLEHGVMNYLAPMGQKVMGLHVGDQIDLTLDGRDLKYEVMKIDTGLQD